MAISKIIYKENAEATPVVWMDTTDKTADSGNMLNGITALKNDGTTVTGNIASKTSSDLTVSGATVTAPAGYYASAATKSVATGSAATPATTITANPSISVSSSGLITASNSKTQSVTPTVSAGYVSSGTAGTITVSGSNTEQLTTQAAQTIYPSTTDQTISSGKYLTGTQTIKGVLLTNLTADNIKKDVVVKIGDAYDDDRIISITGTYTGAASTYSVTISLTNPIAANYFHYFQITEQITSDGWQDSPPSGEGSRLGSISSPTGSTTITIDSSSYGFFCAMSGNGPEGASWPYPSTATHFTCTGGVTYAGWNSMSYQVFQVTGDGTVTIDGIRWEDD